MRLLQHEQCGHAAARVLLRAAMTTTPSLTSQPVTDLPTALSALAIPVIATSIRCPSCSTCRAMMTADAGFPESGQDPQSSAEEASIGDAQTEFQRNRYYVAL